MAMFKAVKDAFREYRRRMQRYAGPIKVITENEAPFPEQLKRQLKLAHDHLSSLKDLEDSMLQTVRASATGSGKSILATNIEKTPGKHPAWMDLRGELYKILREKM